ncbi:hypothetical protein CFC21_095082 [Triticum aestivum]|uniref:Uncharacterized protein n=4 Tax=Triticum TaxID=4564 RepID=A0A9R0Z105_TRITD|nr:protein NPG1-like [Triticum aestivum]KAF7092617.1 hypothetical protein CFC21_095082 [Triticum aestivum]VAI68448.1 unnamed protein product [Triticum turgidum subsp. durum]
MAEPEDGGEVAPPEAAAAATSAAAHSSPPAKEEPAAAAEAKPASSGEAVSLNYEEARALLGRLEFQKGNVEDALCVFDGIDLQAAIERFQPSSSKKTTEATLVLEAIYLKALSLQKLGKSIEAAKQCKSVIDSVESMFKNGTPDIEQKLQETINKSVELLPEAWKKAGSLQETFASYRRALLSPWNLDEECIARIQKRFAAFLLYGCVEWSPPSSGSPAEGTFVPKTNIEEAILLLTTVLKKFYQGKTHWDPSVMEHLTYALSICSRPSLIADHLEEVLPGIYPRTERWNTLAFCYYGVAQKEVALNFLRKSLNKHENPKDTMALLLAAKICSEDCRLASEGVEYARRAIANTESLDVHLKSTGLHFLGSCLSKKAKIVSSDHQRAMLHAETMKSLTESMSLDRYNPNLIFDMGVQYAEQRNMNAALRCAKEFVDATGGAVSKGWRFLALVLSAQQRYSEAEVATNAALDETAKWDQGSLLRIKAKLKVAQSSPMEAVEAYRVLLALVQAQKNSPKKVEGEAGGVTEFEIWQGLANLYSGLSHTRDAEVCLQKATALKSYSAATLEAEGYMHEVRKESKEAMAAYVNASATELDHVSSKVAIGALLSKQGGKYLPAARAFLSDALRVEPTNRMAWLNLGKVHKLDGRISDAADCFQAAVMLEESDPVESFRTLS